VQVAVLQPEAEHNRSEEGALDAFLVRRRGFIVKRLTALGRETANTAKGRFDLGPFTVLKAATIAKETEGNAADVILKVRRDGAATTAMWRRQTRHL
jgi:hypothetical protein